MYASYAFLQPELQDSVEARLVMIRISYTKSLSQYEYNLTYSSRLDFILLLVGKILLWCLTISAI